jgi:hypothetical protein
MTLPLGKRSPVSLAAYRAPNSFCLVAERSEDTSFNFGRHAGAPRFPKNCDWNAKALRSLGRRLHACGPRAVEEFIIDLARGRDFAETVADFFRLDPGGYRAVVALYTDLARGRA